MSHFSLFLTSVRVTVWFVMHVTCLSGINMLKISAGLGPCMHRASFLHKRVWRHSLRLANKCKTLRGTPIDCCATFKESHDPRFYTTKILHHRYQPQRRSVSFPSNIEKGILHSCEALVPNCSVMPKMKYLSECLL